MSSSKGWGDDLNAAPQWDPQLLRVYLRGSIAVVVGIAVLLCISFGWRLMRSRCEPLLDEAILLLDDIPQQDSNAQFEHRARAESLLREYLDRGGKRDHTARLYLCCALSLQSRGNPGQPILKLTESDDLLDSLEPEACTTEELLGAIEIFIYCGQMARADWLVGAALQQSEGSDNRKRVLRLAAEIRYDAGREKDVLEHCRELAELDPSDPEPWRLISWVHEDGGFDERMNEALIKAIELAPDAAVDHRLKLTESLIRLGDLAQAQQQFAALRDQAPDFLTRHPLLKAKLLVLQGNTQDALPIIDRVLEQDPKATEAMLLKGKILLSKGQVDDAVRNMEALLKIDPMQPEAHYVLGQAVARRGEKDDANEHLRLHRKILDMRVRAHGLERRAGRNPADLEVREQLVQLYDALNMPGHAEFWRRAIETATYGGGR